MKNIELNLFYNNNKILVKKNKYDDFSPLIIQLEQFSENIISDIILEHFGFKISNDFNITTDDDLIKVNYKLLPTETLRIRLNRNFFSFKFENQLDLII